MKPTCFLICIFLSACVVHTVYNSFIVNNDAEPAIISIVYDKEYLPLICRNRGMQCLNAQVNESARKYLLHIDTINSTIIYRLPSKSELLIDHARTFPPKLEWVKQIAVTRNGKKHVYENAAIPGLFRERNSIEYEWVLEQE